MLKMLKIRQGYKSIIVFAHIWHIKANTVLIRTVFFFIGEVKNAV